jgi:transcriptional regulator with XRE-family HTH domain
MSSISGERLRTLREDKRETQAFISEMLGFQAKQAYTAVEAGRELSYENLIKVSKHFGVSTDYITGASKYRTIAEETQAQELELENQCDPANEDAMTIFKALHSLLYKYRNEGETFRNLVFHPFANQCQRMVEAVKDVTYEIDDNGDTLIHMGPEEFFTSEKMRQVHKACYELLQKGF